MSGTYSGIRSSLLPPIPDTTLRNCWQNSTYRSTVTGEHGMEYQKEVAFHIWLRLVSLGCRVYALYYEMKECHKFDDIAVHFGSDGQEYAIYVQTKHHIRGNDRFDIKKHIDSLLDGNIQRHMPRLDGQRIKYVFLTTVARPLANPQPISAYVQPYVDIFERFTIAGAKTFRLGEQNRAIVANLVENARSNVLGLTVDYILDNIIIVSQAPNLETLRMINNSIIRELSPNITDRHLICIVRDNFFHAIDTCDSTMCLRKTLNQSDFLMPLSFLEYDLEELSREYCKIDAPWIKFKRNFLDCMTGQRYIVYDNMHKLNALKLIQAIRLCEANFFIVLFNRLQQYQKDLLARFRKKTIIVLDKEDVDASLWDNPNLTFVLNKNRYSTHNLVLHLTNHCSVDELDDHSRNLFMKRKVKIQNSELTVQQFKDFLMEVCDVCNAHEIIEMILEQMPENDKLHFGRGLSRITNYVYEPIFRFIQFHDNEHEIEFDENDVSLDSHIIYADPGMGKTEAMTGIAKIFKIHYPFWWIEGVSASSCSRALRRYSRNSDLSEDEATALLLGDIICYGKSKAHDRYLVKKYLTRNGGLGTIVPIFLFIDAFDKVEDDHVEQMINFITKLCRLGIRVSISAHYCDESELKKLPNFQIYELRLKSDHSSGGSCRHNRPRRPESSGGANITIQCSGDGSVHIAQDRFSNLSIRYN